MSSQVPYLEHYVGPPHVFTVDIENLTAVHHAIQTAMKTTVRQ